MKITENPSHNFSNRKTGAKINSIVLHYTGMVSFEAAINRMKNPDFEVSAHYCVDVDGSVHRLVEDKYKAWHSGESFWRGIDKLNDYSVGIEIANKGHQYGYEKFSDEQIKSVTELCRLIIKNNPDIDQRNIVGHSDIAPDRKEDPGELFPWGHLANNGIGIYHTINYGDEFHYREPSINDGESGKEIGELQRKLSVIGYKIQKSTIFDEQTKKVVAAFYRRFIPERISLSENTRYPENIKWDGLSDVVLNDLFQKFSS
jgi:N-acetylmuramoyl-L-alanine amidase